MSRFNSCFLTCIQISQEAGQLVWYFHLFENLPQFVVSHTVKAFSTVFTKSHEIFNTSLKNVSGESRDITLPTNVCLVKTMVSNVLAWRIPGMGEPGGLPSMGSHSRTRLSDFTFHFPALEKEMADRKSVV